ncbi:hypothetical protein C8J57DRAFT_1507520 [Mycena rebaudengoi]|nr:hypothetical protein C8J57DRAFT_1507520 [Mycena rebaudengoi]
MPTHLMPPMPPSSSLLFLPIPALEPGSGTSLIEHPLALTGLTVGFASASIAGRQKPAPTMTASKNSTTPRNLWASEWIAKHHCTRDTFNAYWASIGDTAKQKRFIVVSEVAKEAKAKAAV